MRKVARESLAFCHPRKAGRRQRSVALRLMQQREGTRVLLSQSP